MTRHLVQASRPHTRLDWRDGPATVYRIHNASGELLYVGLSGVALQRLQQHASDKDWWKDAASVTLEHFDRRFDARVAEERAIAEESPKHNSSVAESIARRRAERAQALEEARRPSNVLAAEDRRRAERMYRVDDLKCGNCGWDGRWVKKGCRIPDVSCPSCGCAQLTGTPVASREEASS